MTFAPIPENPRILVSNDDGIGAPGLAVLLEIAEQLSDDIWVAAPEFEQSGASRKLSLSDPIRVRKVGERQYSVSGTPSDAVFLGIHDLVEGKRPDLVLSGVNRGQNLAEDITVSGTVAAALQGMQMGIRSVALSQALHKFTDGAHVPWGTALALAPDLLRRLCARGWPAEVVLNINFPPCPPEEVTGVVPTRHGQRDQWHMHAERRTDPRGRTYYWFGFAGQLSTAHPGDDLHAIYNNHISITPIRLELTDRATLDDLAQTLAAPFGVAAAASSDG